MGEAYGVNLGVIRKWVSQYRQDGEAALGSKRGGSSPVRQYCNKKDPGYTQQLKYELAKAKVEIAKLKNI